jgi:predicted DNA-binding protein
MPFSLRLDPDTEARIRVLAKSTNRSKSAVVREAMAQYAAAEIRELRAARTALDRLQSFVGIVSTGHQHSTDTHLKYRSSLERKHRGRRPR